MRYRREGGKTWRCLADSKIHGLISRGTSIVLYILFFKS